MNKLAKRAWFALALATILTIGLAVIVVKYFVDSPNWVTFQSAAGAYTNHTIDGGKIYDRSGALLLDNSHGRTYPDDSTLRRATLHLLGDRDGYIPNYLLREYSDRMVGFDRFNGTYRAGSGSGEMRLTVSAAAQKAALDALGGRKGAVGVYNYKTGDILCMVSTPTYDPNDVPQSFDGEQYEGVFVNRFLHSAYPPGSTFKVVTASAALDLLPDIETHTFHCDGSAMVGAETVICNRAHGDISFGEALAQSCNVAFAQITDEIGAQRMESYVRSLGITESLRFDGFVTEKGHYDLSDATKFEAAWSGVGQYTDQINPCQYMMLMGAIGGGGKAALPRLVERVTFNGKTVYHPSVKMSDRLFSSDTAQKLTEYMHDAAQTVYGGSWTFCGKYGCAKSGTAQVGGGKAPNAMFAGFLKDDSYPLAFFVVVENSGGGTEVCTPIVQQVLSVCISAMDA